MKRVLLVVLFMLVLFTSRIYAADVYVLDEDNYGGPIGGFYSGLYGGPGSTAAYISGELTADKLVGGRLLWVIPAHNFTPSEISVMASFLNSGGRIGFLGGWYGFFTARDDSINAAIASLGGHISINTNYVDNGYPHYVYRSNDQILSDPLTNTVNLFVYGIFSPLSLSGSAKALVLGQDGSSVLLAYEIIGAGTVFVMSSQSAWDLDYAAAGTDNRALFINMLYADTGASPLYTDFGSNGIWQYSGSTWSQLTPYDPTAMTAAGSLLYANFGNGVYMYNGSSWSQLTPYSPTAMTATGSLLYANYDNGIWLYNGSTWSQVTPYSPTAMTATGSLLYANYSNGIWLYNGSTWSQLTPYNPTAMTASGSLLYGNYDNGIWLYDGSSWSQLTPYNPTAMTATGPLLYANYGNGVYMYNGSTWSQITPYSPEAMTVH
jgi:hypothetical protein